MFAQRQMISACFESIEAEDFPPKDLLSSMSKFQFPKMVISYFFLEKNWWVIRKGLGECFTRNSESIQRYQTFSSSSSSLFEILLFKSKCFFLTLWKKKKQTNVIDRLISIRCSLPHFPDGDCLSIRDAKTNSTVYLYHFASGKS